jgi:formylglycine-generating enzyme required for sulfatase activity
MRRLFLLAGLLFALPAHAVSIDWVTVGDPGNDCDAQPGGCFGSVDYVYRIGKYEITNAQYAEFLNAVAQTDTYGLYNTNMADPTCEEVWDPCGGITRNGGPGDYTYSATAGRENMPVNIVSFYDALRFANWLHNGQPTGAQGYETTEDGAYAMIAENYLNGPVITRSADASIFLTSEDEWYKAAYYDASTLVYNLFPFADGFDGAACEAPPGTSSHSANCNWSVGDPTDVGSYAGSASPEGTFDQGGNVWEWNEAIISTTPIRGLRGGSRGSDPLDLAASLRNNQNPVYEGGGIGFRVAMIPEPSTALLLACGLAGLAAARRRRATSIPRSA